MDNKWREILQKVEQGELTPEEGAHQMASASRYLPLQEGTAPAQAAPTPPPAQPAEAEKAEVVDDFESLYGFWKRWWAIPLWVGTGIFAIGVILMAWGNHAQIGFWFVCGIFPLMLGLIVMLLAFWSRKARWLHVRVREPHKEKGANVAISLPLPAKLVGWSLKTFGHFIPGLRDQPQVMESLPDIMAALDASGDPLIVEVNDKDGTEVRVYIM